MKHKFATVAANPHNINHLPNMPAASAQQAYLTTR